jgi:squalene synthase HpnC
VVIYVLAKPQAKTWTLDEAFAYCRRLTLSHYENFTVASWLLPRESRRHIYAAYAFCRHTDDLGDEAVGDRLRLLDEWEADLRRCYASTPDHPILLALRETIHRFRIPPEPFLKLIEANRIDQQVARYATYQELLHYCDHSANPVGHIVLYVFGYSDEERRRLSDATCTALQLTNFWQDVAVDWGKGRVYIPREDMERFGYSEEELRGGIVSDAFRALMKFEIARTRDLFAEGVKLLDLVDGRFRMGLKLFSLGGLAVLRAIERNGYDVFRHRPQLTRWQKARLLIRTCLPARLGQG